MEKYLGEFLGTMVLMVLGMESERLSVLIRVSQKVFLPTGLPLYLAGAWQ